MPLARSAVSAVAQYLGECTFRRVLTKAQENCVFPVSQQSRRHCFPVDMSMLDRVTDPVEYAIQASSLESPFVDAKPALQDDCVTLSTTLSSWGRRGLVSRAEDRRDSRNISVSCRIG